ncbi:MAG TPA: alpha/beta hydrolase [Bacteroidota bacterium]
MSTRMFSRFLGGCIVLLQVSSARQQAADTLSYPPLGKLVQVDGHLMQIVCTGEGSPTVVLEAGAGAFSFDWSLVQPEVAKFARVCSYDRAGQAWSELGPQPRTNKQCAYELHTLLRNAGIPGPYVLVGHSAGGYRVRIFQSLYPEEVVGMVLAECGHENSMFFINGKLVRLRELAQDRPIPDVRTSMPDSDRTIRPDVLKLIQQQMRAMGDPTIDPPYDKLPPAIQKIRLWALSQPEHILADYNPYESEELNALYMTHHKTEFPLGDLPLIVLHRELGNFKPIPGMMTLDQTKKMDEERVSNNRDLAKLSRNSQHIIAKNSTHDIHLDRPELVIEAIRRIVESVRHHRSVSGPEVLK